MEKQTVGAADVGTLNLSATAAPVAAKVHPHAPHAGKKTVVDQSIFCAGCQAKTTHKMSIHKDRNGHREIVATCDCGRALKFPETMIGDKVAFDAHLDLHHKHNAGQVSAAAEQAVADEADDRFKKMMGIKG